MSLNSLSSQEHLAEVEALASLLSGYLDRWRQAETVEARLLIEAEIVELFLTLTEQLERLDSIVAGDHPLVEDFLPNFTKQEFMVKTNLAKLKRLTQQYLTYFNKQRMLLLELSASTKRIKQKTALLSLWDQEKAKYIVSESFLNYDNLDNTHLSKPECSLDVTQGAALLPIKKTTKLNPVKGKIGSKSNGRPGNSNEDVDLNNRVENLINGNPSNWFEYERLDSGPVQCTVVLEFADEQIVNNVKIEPVNFGLSMAFEIQDITFVGSAGETSIKNLLGSNLPSQVFEVKTVGNDVYWSINFLPVKAKTVSITLTQSSCHHVVTSAGATRKRFPIGVKNIELNRVEYAGEGEIGSTEQRLLGNLFACQPVLMLFPENSQLCSTKLEVSFDGGQRWQEIVNDLPTDDVSGSFLWRLGVKRNDEAFSGLTSFYNTSASYEVFSVLKAVSRYQSPTSIALSRKPTSQKVYCMQPKVFRRGKLQTAYQLGLGTGTNISFPLPYSLLDYGINPDQLSIYVNNLEWNRVDSENDLAQGAWCFDDDFKSVLFDANLTSGARVKALLDEESVSLEERSDGFYHKMTFPFDPDKKNITLTSLDRDASVKTMILPKNQKTINLGHKNIVEDTLVLQSKESITYTEVDSRREVYDDADQDYFIDYPNGILHLASATGTDSVKVSFKYFASTELVVDQFDIVYEDAIPWGIKIKKEALKGIQYTDTIGDGPQTRINSKSGIFEPRPDLFTSSNTKAVTLSGESVIVGSVTVGLGLLGSSEVPVEIPFIDGSSEFLGLVPMEREYTTELAGSGGVATFSLAAGGSWYQPFGVSFSDSSYFAAEQASAGAVTATGRYHVNRSNGVVTVWVGTGTLPSGIRISYYYQDPDFDPSNKYSVDYANGTLHSHDALVTGETVTFKSATLVAGYDIAKEIDQYEYKATTNSVEVRTESLLEINSLVKVVWSEASTSQTLDSLVSYFSPTIDQLAFRFN